MSVCIHNRIVASAEDCPRCVDWMAGQKQGYREGQEAMREAAATGVESTLLPKAVTDLIAQFVRDLPIKEQPDE